MNTSQSPHHLRFSFLRVLCTAAAEHFLFVSIRVHSRLLFGSVVNFYSRYIPSTTWADMVLPDI
jgi:hypothetical protein